MVDEEQKINGISRPEICFAAPAIAHQFQGFRYAADLSKILNFHIISPF